MKHLGKSPPGKIESGWSLNEQMSIHFRASLLEAADELEDNIENTDIRSHSNAPLMALAMKLRISAGVSAEQKQKG